jgi:hypothetical protein
MTPFNRSITCRSLRRAVKSVVVIVMAQTARHWIAMSGIKIWLRIDQYTASHLPCVSRRGQKTAGGGEKLAANLDSQRTLV